MTFPNMLGVLGSWSGHQQLQVTTPVVNDFEVTVEEDEATPFMGVLQPMPPEKVAIKPEGERDWKWWTLWTGQDMKNKDIVTDASGKRFVVISRTDWSGGAYYQYDLREDTAQ